MSDRDKTGWRVLQPPSWPRPSGYANGIATTGETIFLAGQIGWDTERHLPAGLAAQVRQALTNIVTLLAEAGAERQHIVRLIWYITDLNAYRTSLPQIGAAYRAIMGRHFPTMSVIGVSELVEPQALVEIEATAVIPGVPRS